MSKTAKILALTKQGLDVHKIAKRLGTSTNYVYFVRWKHGKGGAKKGKKKAVKRGRPAKAKVVNTGLGKVQARRLAKAIKLLQSI